MVDETDAVDNAFPSDESAQSNIPSNWQGVSSEPVQYSGFRPKPFFQALNEILSGRQNTQSVQDTQNIYQTISAPSQDVYQQDAEALKARKQQGSTPFKEEVINCHSFAQSALQLIANDTGDLVAPPEQRTAIISNIVTDISGLIANGMLVFVSGNFIGTIVSFTATTITLDRPQVPSLGFAFQVFAPGNAPSQINGKMLNYLIDFFGPSWNFFDSGNGPIIPWNTVPVTLSANSLKIDYLPAQVVISNWNQAMGQDLINQAVNDLTGPFGPGPQNDLGLDYISNRQIFVQFDSQDAPILIAKPGRVFNTQGFDTVYVTFSGDNGRIRLTGGYGDAQILDTDLSTIKNQNLHMWPGDQVLNDPYLHPVPNSWTSGYGKNANAGGIGAYAFTSANARCVPVIQNKFLPEATPGSGFGFIPYNNAQNGCLVGWITEINLDVFVGAATTFTAYLCVGDPFDSARQFSRRPIWAVSRSVNTSTGVSPMSFSFPNPLRFVLDGASRKNRQNQVIPHFYESYGDTLFFMFIMNSTNYTIMPSVSFYTIGNVNRGPTMIHRNRGDFAMGSPTISNVIISPNSIDNYIIPNTSGYQNNGDWMVIFNNGEQHPITGHGVNSITMSGGSSTTAVGQMFAVVDRNNFTYSGETLNTHPYPLDRIKYVDQFNGNFLNT